jgi:hypothetical protein
VLDVLWTFVVCFFFLVFLWLLVKVVVDIIRRPRGKLTKTLWIVFVILVPIGGVFFYLLVRVLGDLLPRRDVSGGSKALWIVLCIALSYFGLGIYLLSQRAEMAERGTSLAKIRRHRPIA